MQPQYDSVDEIRKAYAKRIREAADDEVAVREIRAEERENIAIFREREAEALSLRATRAQILATSGVPEDWHEYITGGNAEELQASADKVKERLAKLSAPAPEGAAPVRDAASRYGSPSAAGGGPGSGMASQQDPELEFRQDFSRRYNESTVGSRVATSPNDSQATYSVNEGERYVRSRLGEVGLRAMANYGKSDSTRAKVREALDRKGIPWRYDDPRLGVG